MDVNNIKVGNDGDGKRSKLLHTSEIVVSSPQLQNGHSSTINLSYQIVLQDHNYGAPLPQPNSESAALLADQCKKETIEVVSPSATYVPVTNQQRVGLKTLPPQKQGPAATSPQSTKGGTAKTNGTSNFPVNKRQRTTSGTLQVNNCSNGVGLTINHVSSSTVVSSSPATRKSYESPKSSVGSSNSAPPLLVPKSGLTTYPYSVMQGVGGDLNSHLYAAASGNEKLIIKEEDKSNGGISNYVNSPKGWFRNKERTRSRSDLRDSFNDDSNESLSSPHMATESDQEGEETETAPECEGEEDEEEQHEESVTRCICKFGHDDGYMICCDRCSVWQHVECMNLDRNNIPEEYLCELCQPRRVDRARARAVQYRKRQDFRLSTPPPSGREGPGKRTEAPPRSKERYKEVKEEYIDVERTQTPKKICRNNSVSAPAPKYGRGSGINSTNTLSALATASTGKNSLRGEGQKAGKRGVPQKWKRKVDKQDDVEMKDRLPRKRKMMRSKSSSDTIDVGGTTVSENSPTVRGNGSAELLLQWIDHYEEAVTNHYSPELRARVSAVRPNGLFSESLPPPSSTPAYRLASKAGGYKTLVASCPIVSGTPVIECRGKYMLSSQLRPYKTGGDTAGCSGIGGLRPTPHILFHNLSTSSSDNCSPALVVEMCVDGRSYGNEARFVWQSCQPNAEVKHKVEKGSLHLYLVAKMEILDSEEITIAHDGKNPLPCPYEGCPHMTGNKDNGRTGLTSATASLNSSANDVERKRRRRRTSSVAAADGPTTPISSNATGVGAAQSTPSPSTPPSQSGSVSNVEPAPATTTPSTPPTVNAPPPTPVKRQYRTPSKPIPPADEDSADGGGNYDETDGTGEHDSSSIGKKKLSREERKMEAIMKAFERLEKAEQRRQETMARMAHRKDGKDGKEDDCLDADVERSSSPPPLANNSPSSASLAHSADKKDLSCFDSKSRNFRRGIPMRKRGGGTRLRRTSSGAGIGGVSGNGGGSRSRTRALSGEVHSGHSATEEESEMGGNSSSPGQSHSGSLMDESQVMAFKCPKTKKVVFNSWTTEGDLNGSKDFNDLASNPLSLSVPMCYMRNPNPRSPTRPIRTAHLRPSTLASLKSPSGSGSPDPHGESGQSNDENLWAAPMSGSAGGSAKKRWLRQAISEETETESPNSGHGGSSCGVGVGVAPAIQATEVLDHVTPLKKRRLARASLSSETSFTPPSTPTPTLERGTIGSNENTTNESMIQCSTSQLSLTGSTGTDKDESPNVESLSADSSQATPPQCDDGDVVENKEMTAATSVGTNLSASIPTTPLAKDSAEKDPSSNSSLNGFVNESQSWPLVRSATDGFDNNVNAQLDGTPAFLPVEAASLLSLRYSIGDDTSYTSASRPTWEFRAPDAQFMKTRNPNEISSQSGDASPSDAAQLSPAEGRPKPAKKKLSILEYRQRKQNLNNESCEVLKEDLSTGSSDSTKITATSGKDEVITSRTSPITTDPETKDSRPSKPNSSSVTPDECSSSLDGCSSASSDGDVDMSTL